MRPEGNVAHTKTNQWCKTYRLWVVNKGILFIPFPKINEILDHAYMFPFCWLKQRRMRMFLTWHLNYPFLLTLARIYSRFSHQTDSLKKILHLSNMAKKTQLRSRYLGTLKQQKYVKITSGYDSLIKQFNYRNNCNTFK